MTYLYKEFPLKLIVGSKTSKTKNLSYTDSLGSSDMYETIIQILRCCGVLPDGSHTHLPGCTEGGFAPQGLDVMHCQVP